MPGACQITAIEGVELLSTAVGGIMQVDVVDRASVSSLPWDRYVRLRAAADSVKRKFKSGRVLDVGGYDGAIALFLEGFEVDLLDPETTGGSATAIPAGDRAYTTVTAVDVLEHITPDARSTALLECARVAADLLVLNYPCRESAPAQELMLKLTGNAFVKQHVEWPLPDSEEVLRELDAMGFASTVVPHTSAAIWLGQFLAQNLMPDAAPQLNQMLVNNHADDPFSVPLYHLVIAERSRRNAQ